MAVEVTLVCDNCKKRGPKMVGSSPNNAANALRGGNNNFTRFRAVHRGPLSDLCPKCAKLALAAKEAESPKLKAKAKATKPKAPAKSKK